MLYKLGRRPRARNHWFPHYSAVLAGTVRPFVPAVVDYTALLPADLGMMLNDQLGDCAEAGWYHAEQVFTANAQGAIVTAPNAIVQQFYSEVTGFNPNAPLVDDKNPTDQGTALQDLLAYLVKTGAPMADGTRRKILGAYEVDPRNSADLNQATYEGGVIYGGFNVPQYLMDGLTAPGSVWDMKASGDATIVGGHCVISAKYSANGNRGIISWGSSDYTATPTFFSNYFDEAYVVVTQDWVDKTGRTPGGLSLDEMQAQMAAAFKAAA